MSVQQSIFKYAKESEATAEKSSGSEIQMGNPNPVEAVVEMEITNSVETDEIVIAEEATQVEKPKRKLRKLKEENRGCKEEWGVE